MDSIEFQTYKYMEKLTPKQSTSDFVCIINSYGQRVCYNNKYQNEIRCDNEKCLVNFKTLDQSFIDAEVPNGVKINMTNNGNFSALQFIGVFPKSDLEKMTKITQTLPINSVERISDPYFGIPKKPLKCYIPKNKGNDECKKFAF